MAAKRGNFETLRILIKHPGLRWDLENKEGETALSLVLRNEELLLALLKELKIYVSKLMTKRFDDIEVTNTPMIFALENDLSDHIVKILVAGASTQDIVDLVLYSSSSDKVKEKDLLENKDESDMETD